MIDEIESILITKEELSERIAQLGQQIFDDYIDESIFALCILKGSFIFFADLVRNIGKPVEVAFFHAASYFEGTESSGHVEIDKHVVDVSGKNLIIIEDIIDSGRTLTTLIEYFKGKKPKSIKVCTLLDKPERRVFPLEAHYVGFEVPDEFVVGYGLDYDQKYRNLPYIGILKREIYS